MVSLVWLGGTSGGQAASIAVEFIGLLDQAVHPAAVNEPADTQEAEREEVHERPARTPQVQHVGTKQTWGKIY